MSDAEFRLGFQRRRIERPGDTAVASADVDLSELMAHYP